MNEMIERLAAAGPEAEKGDYEQEGLLYCGKCRTPKQAYVELGGTRRLVTVMCRCRNEQYEREKRQDEQNSRYLRVMQHPAVQAGVRLQTGREQCHRALLRYLDRWEQVRERNIGLLLWGDVGTGKSTSAAYVAQELENRRVPCLMTNLSRLVNAGFEMPSLNCFDLLVLDDLGAERQTDYMLERMHAIVDERVCARKPLIVTTNLTVDEMRNPAELAYRRMFDRILSVCVPIQFKGESRRIEQKDEKLGLARRLLHG